MGFSLKNMKKIFALFLGLVLTSIGSAQAQEARQFTVTGYYSPLPNQAYYVTGSYEAEKRLNGHGIAGADGTPVFPGMIAAPASYAFGTVVCLPDFGCGSVHDRGGAIVEAGGRNIARHDRLDLWMGYGEEGLARALDLGLWHTNGTIYEVGTIADVDMTVNFKAVKPIGNMLDLPAPQIFTKNLYVGSNGSDVEGLQTALQTLGLYSGEVDGVFSELVKKAVLDFQLEHFVVDAANETGAGGFGPKTQTALTEALSKYEMQKALSERWNDFHFEGNLSKGKRDESVLKLQEMLVQRELLDHQPTGYFGKLTKTALIQFQIEEGLIANANSAGAGTVGPKTRELLNALLEEEQELVAEDQAAQRQYVLQKNNLRQLAGITPQSVNNLIVKK